MGDVDAAGPVSGADKIVGRRQARYRREGDHSRLCRSRARAPGTAFKLADLLARSVPRFKHALVT
jgi:hypothetical protein